MDTQITLSSTSGGVPGPQAPLQQGAMNVAQNVMGGINWADMFNQPSGQVPMQNAPPYQGGPANLMNVDIPGWSV